ncbi:MAG: hypothetical protein KUG72_10805 [Pseudomonadales bacterium]|nr:hypothetical protein [Pseudomonadales bacterium]
MDDEYKLDTTIPFLKWFFKNLEGLFDDMEAAGDWFSFNGSALLLILDSLEIDDWSEHYLDEEAMRGLSIFALFDDDEIGHIAANPDSAAEWLKSIVTEHVSAETSYPTLDEIIQFINAASDDVKLVLHVLALTFLTTLFDCLARMTHGQSLCELVLAARNGEEDDDDLLKAVQIDRSILSLEFVKRRIKLAQFSGDDAFLKKLAYRMMQPTIKGKITHRMLWFTFAFLDREGFLALPHDRLLDICQQLGVYGTEPECEEVGHFRKRLREYRRRKSKK